MRNISYLWRKVWKKQIDKILIFSRKWKKFPSLAILWLKKIQGLNEKIFHFVSLWGPKLYNRTGKLLRSPKNPCQFPWTVSLCLVNNFDRTRRIKSGFHLSWAKMKVGSIYRHKNWIFLRVNQKLIKKILKKFDILKNFFLYTLIKIINPPP